LQQAQHLAGTRDPHVLQRRAQQPTQQQRADKLNLARGDAGQADLHHLNSAPDAHFTALGVSSHSTQAGYPPVGLAETVPAAAASGPFAHTPANPATTAAVQRQYTGELVAASTSLVSDLLGAAALSSGDALGPGITTSSFIPSEQQPAGPGAADQGHQTHVTHHLPTCGACSSSSRSRSTTTPLDAPLLQNPAGTSLVHSSVGLPAAQEISGQQAVSSPDPAGAFSSVDCDDAPYAPPLLVEQNLALAPLFGPPYPLPVQSGLHAHRLQQEQEAAQAGQAAAAGALQLQPAEALMAEAWTAAAGAMAALWGLEEELHQAAAAGRASTQVQPSSAPSPGQDIIPPGARLWQLLGRHDRQGAALNSVKSVALGVGVAGALKQLNSRLGALLPARSGSFRRRLRLGRLAAGSTALSAAASESNAAGLQQLGQQGGGEAAALELPLSELHRVPGKLQELATALKAGWPPLPAAPHFQSFSSSNAFQLRPLPQLSLTSLMHNPFPSSRLFAWTEGAGTAGSPTRLLPKIDQQHSDQQEHVVQQVHGSLLPPSSQPGASLPTPQHSQDAHAQHHVTDASLQSGHMQQAGSFTSQAPRFSLSLPGFLTDMNIFIEQPPPSAPAKQGASHSSGFQAEAPAAGTQPQPSPVSDTQHPPSGPIINEASNGYALDIKSHLFEPSSQAGSAAGSGSEPSQPKGAGWGSLVVATASAALAVGAAVLAVAAAVIAAGMVLAFLASRVAPGVAKAAPVLQSLWRGLQACLRFAAEVWRLWQLNGRDTASGAATSAQ
jgi:hypothetical protein